MLAGARRWPAAVGLAALALAAVAFAGARAAPAPSQYFARAQQVYLAIARATFSADPQVHHVNGCWRLHMTPIRYVDIAIAGGSPMAAGMSLIRRLPVVRTAVA